MSCIPPLCTTLSAPPARGAGPARRPTAHRPTASSPVLSVDQTSHSGLPIGYIDITSSQLRRGQTLSCPPGTHGNTAKTCCHPSLYGGHDGSPFRDLRELPRA